MKKTFAEVEGLLRSSDEGVVMIQVPIFDNQHCRLPSFTESISHGQATLASSDHNEIITLPNNPCAISDGMYLFQTPLAMFGGLWSYLQEINESYENDTGRKDVEETLRRAGHLAESLSKGDTKGPPTISYHHTFAAQSCVRALESVDTPT